MIPASRPYPPPRDVLWLNPQSPQFPPIAFQETSARLQSALPQADQRKPGRCNAVRKSGAWKPAGIGNNKAVKISRYLTANRSERWVRKGSPVPDLERRQPPSLASDDSMHNYTSERRRIVAQVRRMARKNSGFFASQNYGR